MGSTRRKFTPEYKSEAVQFVISSGRPVAEVARNLGVVEGTLGSWVAKARENGEAKEPELDVSGRDELQTVKMERDFLKKVSMTAGSRSPGRYENLPSPSGPTSALLDASSS